MDITDDTLHSNMLRIFRDGKVPEYVLDANPNDMTKAATAKLPDALFADRVNRRYPIDSKASTWLSAAYFAKTASGDAYSSEALRGLVRDTIKLAADKYGIRKDVDEAMEALSRGPAEKKAADDESNYGWPSEKKYPMFDEHGVKMANSYFAENCFNYPPAMRRTIAERIFQKCAEYGVEANDVVRREAGQGFNLREDVGVELVDRVKMASHDSPELASALAGAAQAMLEMPMDRYQGSLAKFAALLDRFDEETGFADRYGVRFRSPMEIFHGRNIKEASDFLDDSVQLGGDLFSITKLAGLPMDLFTSALGDDFGDMIRGCDGGSCGSMKAMRITKKVPGGLMRITISGGVPEMMDGGFGFDSDKPIDVEDTEDAECNPDECEKAEEPKEFEEDDGGEGVIDVKKLGKALKALPERDRNALRKAIELYMD